MTRSQQPDPRLVYARTIAGDDETSACSRDIAHSSRRILALIDGLRRVGDLAAFARPGELGSALAELERHALIEVIGVAAEPSASERRAREIAEQRMLDEAKRRLRGAFADELGTAAHVWQARAADSVNMEVLRRVLREAVDVVQTRRGEAAARRVLEAVRPIFESIGDHRSRL